MPGIEEIDKNLSKTIEQTEIEEALKSGGFLTEEKNITAVAEDLQNKENLSSSMEASLNSALDAILLKTAFENDDMQMLNLRNTLLGEKETAKKEKLKTKMETMVKAVSTKVNSKIADNKAVNGTFNGNHYTLDDTKAIQLRANVCFDEDLTIDGERNSLFYSSKNTENEKLTNIYIYRQELSTRSEVIADRKLIGKTEFNELLDVPNLEDLLATLGDIDIQNKVFGEFLGFFRGIREAGMYFEDKIGSNLLSDVLLIMINKEKYNDVTVDEYFKELKEKLGTSDIGESIFALKTEITEEGYATMGEYFAAEYKTQEKKILAANKNDIKENTLLATAIKISDLEDEIIVIEEDVATLDKTLLELTEKRKLSTRTKIDEDNYRKLAFTGNYLNTDIKKEEKILKMLEIYKLKSDYENYPLKIYLELKASFDDAYIKIFLEKNKEYGLSYSDYQVKIKTYNDIDKSKEIKKWDPILDILLQYNAKEEIRLETPTLEEFKTNCYSEYRKALKDAPGMYKEVTMVPFTIQKLFLPGSIKPIYVKTDGLSLTTPILPPSVSGKKIIAIDIPTKKGELSLTLPNISDMKFGYIYEDKDKNLIVEDATGKFIKTISSEDQKEASNALNLSNLDTYDYNMKNILHTFETADTELSPIMEGYDKFNSDKGINETEVADFYEKFSTFEKYSLPLLEGKVSDRKKSLAELKIMQSVSGGIKNTSEEQIENIINAFDRMINFYEVKGTTSQARELFDTFPQVGQNDTNWEGFKTWMKNNGVATLCAIAGAVAAIILAAPSLGTSLGVYGTLLATAAITTASGMVSYRLGTVLNEGIQNTYNPIYINGQKVEYINKTDVEKYMDGAISSKEFRTNIGTEFIVGTCTTFSLMAAGTIVGQALSKAGFNSGILKPTTRLGKFVEKTKTLIGREATLANNAANSFGKKFMTEFTEETFEEVTENSSQAVHPVLGGIMTFINCLNGHPSGNFINKLSGGLNSINKNTKTITTEFTYKPGEDISDITKFFKETKGYTLVNPDATDGKFIFTNDIDPENQTKTGKTTTQDAKILLDTHIITLIPSNASVFLNNSAPFFADYNAKINHEATNATGEAIDEITVDQKNFAALKIAIELGNMGTVYTDAAGNSKIVMKNETIYVKIDETTAAKNTIVDESTITNGSTTATVDVDVSKTVDNITIVSSASDNSTTPAETLEEQIRIEDEIKTVEDDLSKFNDLDIQEKALKEIEIKTKIEKIISKLTATMTSITEKLKSIKTDLSTLKTTMDFLDRNIMKLNKYFKHEIHNYNTGYPLLEAEAVITGGIVILTEAYQKIRIAYKARGGEFTSTDFDVFEKTGARAESIVPATTESNGSTTVASENVGLTATTTTSSTNTGNINVITNTQSITVDKDILKTDKTTKIEEISEKVKTTYDEIVADIQKNIDDKIDVEKNTYMLASMKNLSSTSRTAKGVLDASASVNKKFKFENITPEDAGIKALQNFQKLSEYIYDNRDTQFASINEVKLFVEKIAKEANDGILKPEYFMRDENPDIDPITNKPKYAYTDKNDVNTVFEQFCKEFYTKLNDKTIDPIELAAWVEYRVNIKDHFFADGCGKTSILLSNFVLMRNNISLPDIRGEGKERFKYSGETQRDVNKPEYNPDLETRTGYYKTQFILNDIENIKDSEGKIAYIEDYNKTNSLKPVGNELMIGFIDKSYVYIDKNGTLKYETIEKYINKKMDDITSVEELDKFIEEYNKKTPPKSKEMVLGFTDEYCIIRNDENGEIKKININENKVENVVEFSKMSSQEILEYAIENTDLIIQKYQKTQKVGEEYVVDVDGFRKFIGADEKVDAGLTHEGASYLADYYIDWIIKNNKELVGKNLTIRFVGGGAGSGKSLISKFSPNEVYNGVWDGTMKTYDNAKAKIDKAIENGYDVQIDFVFRNMNDAWNNGVLKRTIEQNIGTRIDNIQDIIDGKYDDMLGNIDYVGRTLPLSAFKKGHLGARSTFAQLYVEGYHKNMTFYSGDGKIEFEDFKDLHKNDFFDENIAKQNVESVFDKGFISEQQYHELLGIKK